jgi:TolB-like protein
MKNKFMLSVSIFLLLSLGNAVWAKEKSIVTVLPFSVHSADNIDYVQQGILDMLTSRISVSDKIELTAKDAVLSNLVELGKKDLTIADVYGLGKKMNADFVVWGSITKIGNNVSIDGKLVDIATYKSPIAIFDQSQGLDEIIPKINDFAQRIIYHISGTAAPAATAISPTPEQQSPQVAREKEMIAGMRASKKGTFTSIPINPDLINAPQPLDRKGFWKSQDFGTEFKGIDIGDVNNDGFNEVVVIDNHNVLIYQKKGANLTLIQQIPGKKSDNYLAVDAADINGNSVKEIIVTNMTSNYLESFVLEWKGGKFVTIASKLPWFLRVIPDASGTPLLLGQRKGTDMPFNSHIYEIAWDGSKYKEDKKMKIPEGLSVYGLALDSLEAHGAEKIIAFDEYDYLNIYDKTDRPISRIKVFGGSKELLWKSDEPFGGSNNFFSLNPSSYSGSVATVDNDRGNATVNTRIITYDTNKDGKKEIIVVKNLSAVGRVFKNVKSFTASEIYNLEWDGMGLTENWRTKKINGYVADYQFKDVDNDGQNEVILALVLSVGATLQEKSVIVAYKLNPQEGTTSK